MHRILIVSEDAQCVSMCDALGRHGFTVIRSADFENAFDQLLNSSRFRALIINLANGTKGIDFIKRVRATPQLIDIRILITAEWGTGYGSLGLAQGADVYEPARAGATDLVAVVQRLLKRHRAVAK